MLNLDVERQVMSVTGALELRPRIEAVVDQFCQAGYDAVFIMGIGGTWASGLQTQAHVKARSAIPFEVEHAAEYLTTGNRRITDRSIVLFSSVTGTTEEMVQALRKVKQTGARILGFIDLEHTALEEFCDYCISYPKNEQLKFFMTADRFLYQAGDFPEYDTYYQEMEAHLPQALAEVEKAADEWAQEFAADKYRYCLENPHMPHYFIGSGTQWGATYSYAMCYWEEQLWLRTKSISAAEFFHGTLEIIDAQTPVVLYIGEDAQRPLAERVARFLPKVCRNYTVIDSKNYELKGIREEYRGSVSHLILRAVNNRIDAHMEREFCHPMGIRRYYRQFDY